MSRSIKKNDSKSCPVGRKKCGCCQFSGDRKKKITIKEKKVDSGRSEEIKHNLNKIRWPEQRRSEYLCDLIDTQGEEYESSEEQEVMGTKKFLNKIIKLC